MSRKISNDPRINIAFYDDNLEFCRSLAAKSHQSITRFINCLIEQEKAKHNEVEWKTAPSKEK